MTISVEAQEDIFDFHHYSAIVWRWKWLIIVGTVLASGAAFVVNWIQLPVYEATTKLLIQAPASQIADFNSLLTSERLARTYAELITNRPVLEESLARLEISMDLEELKSSIDVEIVRDTELIEVTAENTNPVLAANLANTIVEVFSEQNDELQASRFAASKGSLSTELDKRLLQMQLTEALIADLGTPISESDNAELDQLRSELTQYQTSYTNLLQSYEQVRTAEAQSISSVVQVERAEPSDEPVRPKVLANTLMAGFAGAMVAIAGAFFIESLDDSIKTPADAERALGVPILGYVAETDALRSGQGRAPLSGDTPPEVAEAFRSLRVNLEFLGSPGGPRAILISSPAPGEGKTTVSSYLAATIAESGRRVALVDADLRRPGVHKFFGIPNKIGLSDMLKDDLVPQVAAQTIGNHRIKVITSGSRVENPAELLGSVWFLKVLTYLRELADVTIFDGPSFMASEAFILAARLEGVLMVIQPGQTRQAAARTIIQQLNRARANLLGVMLNRVPGGQLYGGAQFPHYDYDWQPRQEDGPTRASGPQKAADGANPARRGAVVMKREPRED